MLSCHFETFSPEWASRAGYAKSPDSSVATLPQNDISKQPLWFHASGTRMRNRQLVNVYGNFGQTATENYCKSGGLMITCQT